MNDTKSGVYVLFNRIMMAAFVTSSTQFNSLQKTTVLYNSF